MHARRSTYTRCYVQKKYIHQLLGQTETFYSSFHTVDREQLKRRRAHARSVSDYLHESAAHFTRRLIVVKWIASLSFTFIPWNMQVDRPFMQIVSKYVRFILVYVSLQFCMVDQEFTYAWTYILPCRQGRLASKIHIRTSISISSAEKLYISSCTCGRAMYQDILRTHPKLALSSCFNFPLSTNIESIRLLQEGIISML